MDITLNGVSHLPLGFNSLSANLRDLPMSVFWGIWNSLAPDQPRTSALNIFYFSRFCCPVECEQHGGPENEHHGDSYREIALYIPGMATIPRFVLKPSCSIGTGEI